MLELEWSAHKPEGMHSTIRHNPFKHIGNFYWMCWEIWNALIPSPSRIDKKRNRKQMRSLILAVSGYTITAACGFSFSSFLECCELRATSWYMPWMERNNMCNVCCMSYEFLTRSTYSDDLLLNYIHTYTHTGKHHMRLLLECVDGLCCVNMKTSNS